MSPNQSKPFTARIVRRAGAPAVFACLILALPGQAPAAEEPTAGMADGMAAAETAAPDSPADTGAVVPTEASADAPADTPAGALAGAPAGAPEAAAAGLPVDGPGQAPEGGTADAPADAMLAIDDALPEDIDPLDRVARQIEAREFRESVNWLESHIDTIEAVSHRFDPALVRPLTLLGDALAGQGSHDEALESYRRALHLNRVSSGLNSPEQVGIVYREAEALKALGRYRDANDREEYAYHVLSRAHGPLDEALLPGIYHLAEWYERTNNVFAARALYEQAVTIIDHHDKLETLEAVPALRGIAESYRLERFPRYYMADLERDANSIPAAQELRHPVTINNFPAGEAALQRVVRIQQNADPVDPIALAESVLELADWYTLFEKSQRAETLYAHAWELMAEVDGFDVVGYFAEPTLLYFPEPGDPTPPPPEQRGPRETGYVEVAFDVTDEGQVRDLDTVASKPDGLMDFRVRKSLRLARYRPMLVDGVPVFRGAYTYRHEFPYYPERSAETDATATAVTPAGSPGS